MISIKKKNFFLPLLFQKKNMSTLPSKRPNDWNQYIEEKKLGLFTGSYDEWVNEQNEYNNIFDETENYFKNLNLQYSKDYQNYRNSGFDGSYEDWKKLPSRQPAGWDRYQNDKKNGFQGNYDEWVDVKYFKNSGNSKDYRNYLNSGFDGSYEQWKKLPSSRPTKKTTSYPTVRPSDWNEYKKSKYNGPGGYDGWKKKQSKKKSCHCPSTSAKNFPVGTTKKGNDQKMWKVTLVSRQNGKKYHRWTRVVPKKTSTAYKTMLTEKQKQRMKRPSPPISANRCDVGTEEIGNDGNLWRIKEVTNNKGKKYHRWEKVPDS